MPHVKRATMKKLQVWAVVYSYETLGNSREDVLDSWFRYKRHSAQRLKEQESRYPRTEKGRFYLCRAVAWQDDLEHWHVRRAQI